MATDPFTLDFGRDKPFCVYIYRDPRKGKARQPIYVGKGDPKSRPDQHWKYGTQNPLFRNVLAKIRELHLIPIIETIEFFDIEAEAFKLETALIKKIGRRDLGLGPLCNLTDGGEGVSGWVAPPEFCEKQSNLAVARWATPEHRAKLEPWLKQLSEAKKGVRPVRPDNDRWITANGEKKQLLDWASALGCHPAAIINRVKNQGMTWEEAATTPIVSGKGAYQVTLSREQGAEIIARYIGGESQPALAKEFSVSGKTILNVLQGKRFPELRRDVEAIRRAADAGRERGNKGTGLMLTHDGQTHSIKEWSKLVGIHENVIRERKRRGLSDADALAHVNASGEHNRKILETDYPEVARLRATGESLRAIGNRYGVEHATIRRVLRNMRTEAAE